MKALSTLAVFLGALAQLSVQQQGECSASKLCPAGCCSSAGYCGYGPEFCGKGCQSTCNRKADCDPGWAGSNGKYSKKDKCPLNVCCSKHGFCGYTDEFCEGKQVKRPSCSVSDAPVDRVIGYYEGWATSKRGCYALRPEEIPHGVYTHLIFSFATINPHTYEVSAGDDKTGDMMDRIGTIKILQPDLKIWVALGGWAFNDPGPTQTTFSDVAGSAANTDVFLGSLVRFLDRYGFDGVDIDWEYPVAADRQGREQDYANIVTLMKELRLRLKPSRRGVSMALPASYWYLQNFDVVRLQEHVDWFNLMTYDMHGAWDIDNKWTGPWANSHTNLTEIQLGLDLLWRNDIRPEKVTIGMSYYARTFTLTDPACRVPGCRVSSAGEAGRCSGTAGVLLHPEIQEILAKDSSIKPVLDREAAVKTVSWGNQWTSFDDAVTWRLKANKLRGQCISGFMVWAISQDDKSGTNALALASVLGRKKPAVPDFTLRRKKPDSPDLASKTCRWTSCFDGCPSGFKEVQRDGHKEIMLDTSSCAGKGHGFSRLCCPTSFPSPKCLWRGHRNTGRCKPGCEEFELEVGSLNVGCHSGYQSACCSDTLVTSLYSKCVWTACSPKTGRDACASKNNNPHFLASSSIGSGGMNPCKKGEKRSLCCVSPTPYDVSGTCTWGKKVGSQPANNQKLFCEDACSADQLMLAQENSVTVKDTDTYGCLGHTAFCCSEPQKKKIEPRDDPGASEGREFQTLIRKYGENPTCPATLLFPPLHDRFTHKRSLKLEKVKSNDIMHRPGPRGCSTDTWVRLLQYATLLFSRNRASVDPLVKVWDTDFAYYHDKQLEYEQLSSFLHKYPVYEPRGVVEWVLYNPLEAGPGIRGADRASQTLCQVRRSKKRSDSGSHSDSESRLSSSAHVSESHIANFSATAAVIESRKIDAWGTGHGSIPALDTILTAILSGAITLHYARWQYYRGTSSGNRPGPMLELAYWLGREPGRSHNEDISQYQDRRPRERWPSDQWVLFHFHFDDSNPHWLIRENGQTYAGVFDLRVMHGQYWMHGRPGQAWRVSRGNADYNTRDGFTCEEELNSLWYVGAESTIQDGEPEWARLLHRWGQTLHRQGYVNTLGLRMIIDPPQGADPTEINPELPGTVSRGGGTSVVGGLNPYNINFLLEGSAYQFTANPAPQDREDPDTPA
ncbi:hypothetical protein E4U21_007025 [Claviceps maximensis]|nr:hypothetical protein E4U21_007025 [Claviceps maximensis]